MSEEFEVIPMADENTLLQAARCLPADVAPTATRVFPELANAGELAEWLFSRETLRDPAVCRYVSFLKLMYETSMAIAEVFDLRSPPNSRGTKEHLRHTEPEDMLFLANHLYVLDSLGVPGALLECGTSHGYSTCCLSHACGRLGRKLFSADSFAGLPATQGPRKFFEAGDYRSSKEAVREVLRQLGRPDVVTLVEGWFSESLKGWSEPLAMLWLDVDLYDSARDVMANVGACLDPRGAVFTHEFTDFHNRPFGSGDRTPPHAVGEHFGGSCVAVHLARYLGCMGGARAAAVEAGRLVASLHVRLKAMDVRSRSLEQLRSSRTVRAAFALKRLLLGR